MGKQKHRRRRGSLSRANCYHNSFCFFLVFLWILSAQFSLSTFSFAFFFFFRAPESQLCTKSERSEWMEGDCDLFVRHIQHRKRKGREGDSTKSRKNRRGECGPEVYGNTLPVIAAFVWLNART